MKVVLELKDSVLREFNFEKKNAALTRAYFYVRVFLEWKDIVGVRCRGGCVVD